MKRDLKPFVVEVKRGTRRSSFLGHMDQSSTMSEAQRRAEAALFAPVVEEVSAKAAQAEPSRRILRSLVEPPPALPPVAEDDAMLGSERRPRPVGRPRKVHPPQPAVRPERVSASFVLPPAVPVPKAAKPVEAMTMLVQSAVAAEVAAVARLIPEAAAQTGERQRLRDRSSILARYVLGTEPAPGERWHRSSRRTERRRPIVFED